MDNTADWLWHVPCRKPYVWQRGLALYYADRFTDGADQFAADVAVNPNDTRQSREVG